MICSMGDVERNAKIPMTSYGRRICHQDQTESNVVLVEEKKQPGAEFARHLVQLLDKALNTLSSFRLNEGELGVSVISCSFAGQDERAYYCVGTSRPPEVNIIMLFIFSDLNTGFCFFFSEVNFFVSFLLVLYTGEDFSFQS